MNYHNNISFIINGFVPIFMNRYRDFGLMPLLKVTQPGKVAKTHQMPVCSTTWGSQCGGNSRLSMYFYRWPSTLHNNNDQPKPLNCIAHFKGETALKFFLDRPSMFGRWVSNPWDPHRSSQCRNYGAHWMP